MTATQAARTDEGPVTVVVSRVVRPDAVREFEAWLAGICREAERFDGHLGVTILRPSGSTRPEYVLIFRFDCYEHLRAWNESSARARWIERAQPFTVEEPRLEEFTGLEHWFTLPGRPVSAPPPVHKMALLTWVAIFPMVLALRALLQPWLGPFGAIAQTLVMTVLLVALMTYVVMPRLTRWCAGWLFGPRR